MDLDYRALSNAGLWAIGRLQTDADRARVIEGLGGGDDGLTQSELGAIVKKLSQRWTPAHPSKDAGAEPQVPDGG